MNQLVLHCRLLKDVTHHLARQACTMHVGTDNSAPVACRCSVESGSWSYLSGGSWGSRLPRTMVYGEEIGFYQKGRRR